MKGQIRHSKMLRAQYLENRWRFYFATIVSLLRGSTVSCPSDSLASCLCLLTQERSQCTSCNIHIQNI